MPSAMLWYGPGFKQALPWFPTSLPSLRRTTVPTFLHGGFET